MCPICGEKLKPGLIPTKTSLFSHVLLGAGSSRGPQLLLGSALALPDVFSCCFLLDNSESLLFLAMGILRGLLAVLPTPALLPRLILGRA